MQITKNVKQNIVAIVLTVFSIFSVKYFFNMENITNIFLLCILVGIFVLYKYSEKFMSKRKVKYACIFGVIFSIFYVVGRGFELYKNGEQISIVKHVYYFFALGIFMTFLTNLLFTFISKANDKLQIKKDDIKIYDILSLKQTYIILVLIFLVSIVPTFLTIYPGVMQADTLGVLSDLLKGVINSKQPILYTLMVEFMYFLGQKFFNTTATMAAFTIMQMVCISLSFSYVVYVIYKNTKSICAFLLSTLFFILCPLIPIISTIIVKDVWFSICVLLFFAMSIDFVSNQGESDNNIIKYICYISVATLMCLFRNQGILVLIFTLIFYLILSRSSKKIILSIIISCILYIGINKTLMYATNAQEGSIAEALSVPIQQLARVYNENNESLTQDELETLYKFIPENALKSYIPDISDPVKAEFNDEYFSENKMEFIKLWISVGVKNLKEYIISFLYGSYAYFYVDAQMPHWGTLLPDYETQANNATKYGIYSTSYYEENLENYNNNTLYATYQDYFLLGTISSVGLPIIIVAFDICYLLYIKKYRYIAPLAIIIGLWGTLILGPVISVRYGFPLVICVPLLLSIPFFYNAHIKALPKKVTG